jgi:hypothetical protein
MHAIDEALLAPRDPASTSRIPDQNNQSPEVRLSVRAISH